MRICPGRARRFSVKPATMRSPCSIRVWEDGRTQRYSQPYKRRAGRSSLWTSGNIRTYPPQSSAGIVVFRLGRQSKLIVLAAIAEVAAAAVAEPVIGKLWIVEDGRLRIRG